MSNNVQPKEIPNLVFLTIFRRVYRLPAFISLTLKMSQKKKRSHSFVSPNEAKDILVRDMQRAISTSTSTSSVASNHQNSLKTSVPTATEGLKLVRVPPSLNEEDGTQRKFAKNVIKSNVNGTLNNCVQLSTNANLLRLKQDKQATFVSNYVFKTQNKNVPIMLHGTVASPELQNTTAASLTAGCSRTIVASTPLACLSKTATKAPTSLAVSNRTAVTSKPLPCLSQTATKASTPLAVSNRTAVTSTSLAGSSRTAVISTPLASLRKTATSTSSADSSRTATATTPPLPVGLSRTPLTTVLPNNSILQAVQDEMSFRTFFVESITNINEKIGVVENNQKLIIKKLDKLSKKDSMVYKDAPPVFPFKSIDDVVAFDNVNNDMYDEVVQYLAYLGGINPVDSTARYLKEAFDVNKNLLLNMTWLGSNNQLNLSKTKFTQACEEALVQNTTLLKKPNHDEFVWAMQKALKSIKERLRRKNSKEQVSMQKKINKGQKLRTQHKESMEPSVKRMKLRKGHTSNFDTDEDDEEMDEEMAEEEDEGMAEEEDEEIDEELSEENDVDQSEEMTEENNEELAEKDDEIIFGNQPIF